MNLKFEGEVLNIGGFDISGTVLIETRATDGSFANEFGVEHVEDIEWLVGGFVPDSPCQALDEGLVYREVDQWIWNHERQIKAAYEKAVKAGD